MLGNHLVLHGVRHQAGACGGTVALFGIVNHVAVCSVRASFVAWSELRGVSGTMEIEVVVLVGNAYETCRAARSGTFI
jgi:hypothetical protein